VDFMDALRKVPLRGQPDQTMFKNPDGPRMTTLGAQINWAFSCDLKRADE